MLIVVVVHFVRRTRTRRTNRNIFIPFIVKILNTPMSPNLSVVVIYIIYGHIILLLYYLLLWIYRIQYNTWFGNQLFFFRFYFLWAIWYFFFFRVSETSIILCCVAAANAEVKIIWRWAAAFPSKTIIIN